MLGRRAHLYSLHLRVQDYQLSRNTCSPPNAPTGEECLLFVNDSSLTCDRKNPLLPVTVQDQIRLWEMEQNRVQEAEGTSFYAYTFKLVAYT